jgi:hypothetical protein
VDESGRQRESSVVFDNDIEKAGGKPHGTFIPKPAPNIRDSADTRSGRGQAMGRDHWGCRGDIPD